VLQFGEGGFLRAFVDQMIDAANEAGTLNTSVVVVQPIPQGLTAELDAQDGLYTLVRRGMMDGQVVRDVRVITAISRTINPYADFSAILSFARNPDLRFIVSNSTEAGIVYTGEDRYNDAPQASFPGKLTRLMHERFLAFGQKPDMGFILLPCELIDRNGDALRDAVLRTAQQWDLGNDFVNWLQKANIFTNTLVDRIVTGYPRGEAAELMTGLGYEDKMLDVAEPFGLWVIEGPSPVATEFPLNKAGQNVIFTKDVTPYKLRKVRMLNGAHTSMALGAYLAGLDTVGECMADTVVRAYMERALFREIMPTLDLPKQELEKFYAAILERFENPFNRHELLSIALNSVSKFRTRVLPTILEYHQRKGELPKVLTFSLAALIAFYRVQQIDGVYMGMRDMKQYRVMDDEPVLRFFASHNADSPAMLVRETLSNQMFWGQNLTSVPNLECAVAQTLCNIDQLGMREAMRALVC
jgi:tagaturonate reductase